VLGHSVYYMIQKKPSNLTVPEVFYNGRPTMVGVGTEKPEDPVLAAPFFMHIYLTEHSGAVRWTYRSCQDGQHMKLYQSSLCNNMASTERYDKLEHEIFERLLDCTTLFSKPSQSSEPPQNLTVGVGI